jgi:hypothetical protein
MRLIEQIIQKNLDMSDEFAINRSYRKSVWKFIVAYDISISLLKFKDTEAKMKNILWKKYLSGKKGISSKNYIKLSKQLQKDYGKIIDAWKLISDERDKSPYNFGNYYKEGAIGILAYEAPEEG